MVNYKLAKIYKIINKPILTVKQQKTMNLNNLEHKNIQKLFICKNLTNPIMKKNVL
jgi:hypothetical protein